MPPLQPTHAAEVPEPVVIVSDLHLSCRGRWRDRLRRLRPLWAGAASMVFNGDTIAWATAADADVSRQMLAHLADLCRADGAEAVFLAGNSDFDLVELRHLDLAGGKVLVTHGDVIFKEVCPWRAAAPQLRLARRNFLAALPAQQRQTLEAQLAAARHAVAEVDCPRRIGPLGHLELPARLWRLLKNPAQPWAVMRTWRLAPSLAAELLERYRPRARAIILGHTHRAGLWRIGDRLVINTGTPGQLGRALVARIHDGQIVVRRVGRDYRPGTTIGRFKL